MASTEGSFDDGVSKEKEYSRVLFGSGQAQALQYAFFAQRAATKVRLFVVDLLAGTECIYIFIRIMKVYHCVHNYCGLDTVSKVA